MTGQEHEKMERDGGAGRQAEAGRERVGTGNVNRPSAPTNTDRTRLSVTQPPAPKVRRAQAFQGSKPSPPPAPT